MAKPPQNLHESDDEDDYDENADEDFNPDAAAGDDEGGSSSDDESEPEGKGAGKSRKQAVKRKSEALEEELDSGDEATIKERRKKKRRKDDEEDASSGDERGFVRTRAQRQAEKVEQKERRKATLGRVSVDVDKLWAELNSLPVGRANVPLPAASQAGQQGDASEDKENATQGSPDDLITIKKRITYAGEITEVEEQVPRSSKEAQSYLAEHPEADPHHARHNVDPRGLQRPLKRPSVFEPNPMSVVKGVPAEKLRPRAPSRLDVQRMEEEQKKKAQKMSTVQKSALDWKGFVDREGLRDELDEYGKSKKGFMAREAFLDRAAGAREQAARDARLKL